MWLSDKTACLVCEGSKSKPLYYKTVYSVNLQSFTQVRHELPSTQGRNT